MCGACVEACPTGARQMIGRTMTVPEVVAEVARDRMFYDESGGGVTISGGEPLSQPRFLLSLLRAFREQGIHCTLDTTGYGKVEHLLDAAALSQLVLYDLKAFEDRLHRRLTGVSNRLILENLAQLDRKHDNVWIRLPVVPGFNDDLANLRQTAELVSKLRSVTLVNLLPFHRSGLHKFERLGMTHALDGVETPTPELMERAEATFREFGLKTKVGG